MRAILASDSLDTIEMRVVKLQRDHDILVSLPTYAILAGISLNEIQHQYCNIRIKREFVNRGDLSFLYDRFYSQLSRVETLAPDEDLRFGSWFRLESWLRDGEENFRRRADQLDSVFSIIVIISMALCLFSLTTSMSANIYDQSREITVMRSCGMTKNLIVRLYIYEALILTMSCSFCGFVIGVSIGNLMTLQQGELQAVPFIIELPLGQLKMMIMTSSVLAVASSWASATSMLRKSIPEISRFVK